MKTTKSQQLITVALLLLGSVWTVWAVNGDYSPPCWRDGTGTTRQAWEFERNLNPIDASTDANPHGTPSAAITTGTGSAGHTTNSCIRNGVGCGDVVISATVPGLTGTDECSGPPYLAYTNGATEPSRLAYTWDEIDCITTGSYTSPSLYGTAYGWWDLGTTGGKAVLSIPNNGAPAGTTRFFYIQGTFLWQVAAPVNIRAANVFGVTNSSGVGSIAQVVTGTSNLVEIPLDASGSPLIGDRRWQVDRKVIKVPADTASGTDTITIRHSTSVQCVMEKVIVETLDRAAVADDLGNVALNMGDISFATLLGNDRGSTNIVGVSTPVNGTVSLGAGVVTFTPTTTGAASFWYTNSDCAGLTNLGTQVTMTVVGANTAPLAGNTNYYRPKNISLKIDIANLRATLTSDTEDAPTLPAFKFLTSNANGLMKSESGYTLSTNATYILYTNATINVNDSFKYVVQDSGSLYATGTISITVTNSIGTVTITNNGGGMTITAYGIPGYEYVVEKDDNAFFTSPEVAWTTNLTTPPVISYYDEPAGTTFYRIRTN